MSDLSKNTETDDELSVVEGELVPNDDAGDFSLEPAHGSADVPALEGGGPASEGNQRSWLLYVLLPMAFLTAALLGGLRISSETGEFIFIRPALICLIFATALIVLFFRTGLINLSGWFSESITTLQNAANVAVLVSLFAASVQIFNSLIPEQGISFWVVSFCFLWTLGVSYFTLAEARQLVRTCVAMFGIAFLTKYFLLLNLTSVSSGNWLQRMWDDPTREAVTFLLDLPRYAPATGYLQFFAAGLFLLGLFLIPTETTLRRSVD